MKAKLQGWCAACRVKIVPGDEIEKSYPRGWRHQDCDSAQGEPDFANEDEDELDWGRRW